ncbi:S24 family peptidase [Salinimicrobium sp. GXAS 041]|uniref:S24 family peptidase n=1 Tax=Salinimicrobium sp. GXAS 041 TaxID=3400806 RepID=UPI003C7540D5
MKHHKELLEIRSLAKNKGVTAYDIAKNTTLTEAGVGKILNGVTKSPHKSTVIELLNYLRNFGEPKETSSVPNPEAIQVDFSRFMMVPLVQYRAQAGFLSGWGDPEYIEELPKIPWEVDKEYKGRYICFEVTGDSMDNDSRESLVEKDVLLCREVQRHHWQNKLHIHRWKNFVVVHKYKGVLVKRILEHDIETGRLLLHSLNPMYDDQEVYMDDLVAIFNVIDIHRSL